MPHIDCDKVQYATVGEAMAANKNVSDKQKQSMRVYKCDECGMFHLTTVKHNKKSFKIPKKEKYRKDYTGITPIKRKEKPVKRKPSYQEKTIHSTYKPFANLRDLLDKS